MIAGAPSEVAAFEAKKAKYHPDSNFKKDLTDDLCDNDAPEDEQIGI